MSFLIRQSLVLTMEPGAPAPTATDIFIDEDRIVTIGRDLSAPDPRRCEVIDGRGMIALPGFVNAHIHLWQGGLRGIAGNWTLRDYFARMLGGIAGQMTPEDVGIANLVGAWEQIDSGVTTILDWSHTLHTPEHADAALEALASAGIRAVFCHGPPGNDAAKWWYNSQQQHPEDARRLAQSGWFKENGLLRLGLAIRGPDYSTDEVSVFDIRYATELGAIASMHIGANPQRDAAAGGVSRLAAARVLGPNVNFVHANNITMDEFRMIVDAGASITTTPEVEMQMGMGFPPTGALLRAGGSPSLGTDVACACAPEMFSQMRIALQTQRALDHARAVELTGNADSTVLSVRQALEFATLNGARALGLEDRIGTITPGKQADLLLVKPGNAAGLARIHDPYEAIVLNSSAQNVDTVLIAGKLRKRGGRLIAPPSSRETSQLADSARRLLS